MKTTNATKTTKTTQTPNADTQGTTTMNTKKTKTPRPSPAPAPTKVCPQPAPAVVEAPAGSTPEALGFAKRDAWERTRAARTAITAAQLTTPNFDLQIAAVVMGAAYRRVLPFREQLVRSLPDFEVRCLDEMLTYSAAMQFGDERVEEQPEKVPPVELASDAEKHFAKLLRALAPLADAGLFPVQVLESIREGNDWVGLAKALSRIVTAVSELWAKLEHHTTLTVADMQKAASLSDSLYEHLGLKGEPSDPTQMELERRQAITLAFRSYEQVRRAMSWLRWEEKDANAFAPSVHRNDFMGKRRGAGAVEEPGSDAGKAPQKPAVDTKAGAGTGAAAKKPEPVIELTPDGRPVVPQDDPMAKD